MGKRGGVVVVVTLVLVGLLATAGVTDMRSHARVRQELQAFRMAQHRLATTSSAVAALTYAKGLDGSNLKGLQNSVAASQSQLTANQEALATLSTSAFLQGLDIGTLHTCLGGVQRALQQIQDHDNATATADIAAASTACLTLDGGTNTGMVYPFDFPDPFVLRVGGTYFAYATNSAEGNIQIITSTNLTQWSAVGNALPKLPVWAATGGTWAPSVLAIGGRYLLYYSAVVAGPGGGEECISVASATRPQGPFTDDSTGPLECQSTLGGSIDPSPFLSPTGVPYLQWKSNGGSGQPATVWSEQLNESGSGFSGAGPTELLAAAFPWEAGVIEAPDLVFDAGRYYLFYSGNNWNTANYAVGVASCAGPLGPCDRLSSTPLLASGASLAGPGGESVFTDASGTLWMAFDAWVPGAVGYPHSRSLYIRQLNLDGSQVLVASG